MYNRDTVLGVEVSKISFLSFKTKSTVSWCSLQVYLTTVYFVNPKIICTTGRSQADFDTQGTGTNLMFQNGPNFRDEYLVVAPDKESKAVADVTYLQTLSKTSVVKIYHFRTCGTNTIALSTWVTISLQSTHQELLNVTKDSLCNWSTITKEMETLLPSFGNTLQLLMVIGNRNLSIASDQHLKFWFFRWETVSSTAISSIINNAPQCLYDVVETPGVRTMHVYVKDYVETCLF